MHSKSGDDMVCQYDGEEVTFVFQFIISNVIIISSSSPLLSSWSLFTSSLSNNPHTIIKTSFRSPTTTSAFQLTITSLICPIGFIFWINTCHIDITIDILVINMIQIMLHIMLNHDDGQSYQISLIVFITLYMCCHLTKWWKFKSQGQNQHDWHWDRHHRCVENQW